MEQKWNIKKKWEEEDNDDEQNNDTQSTITRGIHSSSTCVQQIIDVFFRGRIQLKQFHSIHIHYNPHFQYTIYVITALLLLYTIHNKRTKLVKREREMEKISIRANRLRF